MNTTSPALVAQSAVRRLPRYALIGLCLLYVFVGFFDRAPWRGSDVATLGYSLELVHGFTDWLNPTLAGLSTPSDGLLPYWLGAVSIMALQSVWPTVNIEIAARLPFVLMLWFTLQSTWYAVYYLARTPQAQPVAFAFGGEAGAVDYARALADGGLLALLACLGLAQLGHEMTSYLTQLFCASLVFYAVAASPYRFAIPALAFVLGLTSLALSGAPSFAVLMGVGCVVIVLRHPSDNAAQLRSQRQTIAIMAVTVVVTGILVGWLGLFQWRLVSPYSWDQWHSWGRLLIWFAWPAWPMALWALWRWRHQMRSTRWPIHLALPFWWMVVPLCLSAFVQPSDRILLLSLPALATLAALALPTLGRSVGALIDWFTLLFFSVAALSVWVVWISLQTGFPARPAANVARLLPEFQMPFSWSDLTIAVITTGMWIALVVWRTGKHRPAIWKSLVLPAGGTVLAWVLLMTLCMPILDYARSYTTMAQTLRQHLPAQTSCAQFYGLSVTQVAAIQYHAGLRLYPAPTPAATLAQPDALTGAKPSSAHLSSAAGTSAEANANACAWLLIDPAQVKQWRYLVGDQSKPWKFSARIHRVPGRGEEHVLLYQR